MAINKTQRLFDMIFHGIDRYAFIAAYFFVLAASYTAFEEYISSGRRKCVDGILHFSLKFLFEQAPEWAVIVRKIGKYLVVLIITMSDMPHKYLPAIYF